MKESKELEIKNALVEYIKNNFTLEGDAILVNQKVIDLAVGLFDLFESLK